MQNSFLAFALATFAFGANAAITPPSLGFGKWDAYMLGVTTPELAAQVRDDVSNATVRIAVANYETKHDDCQVYEMKMIGEAIGLKLDFVKVYAATNEDLHAVYSRAAKEGDLVIDYKSYWHNDPGTVLAAERAIAENPDKLFLLPYGEIGNCPPTSTSLQGKARKTFGVGHANLITVIPLAPSSKGHIMSPLRRDEKDTSEMTFVAPTSWAQSAGVTCPSASCAAVVAAYAYALRGKKTTAREIVWLMTAGAEIPRQMADLAEFDAASVEKLEADIKKLTTTDTLGRQELVTPGVLSIRGIRKKALR